MSGPASSITFMRSVASVPSRRIRAVMFHDRAKPAAILAVACLRLLGKCPRVGHLAPLSDSPISESNRLALTASEVAHVSATRAVNPCPGEEK